MRVGRFVLAVAALAGWSVAMMTAISRAAIMTSLGFISGRRHEQHGHGVADGENGRFWPFVAGAAAYTALLLLIR